MGSGRKWQTTLDDDDKVGRPHTPPTAETSFSSVSNPTLTTPPHDSSTKTTSLPSFAEAFRDASSPSTAYNFQGRLEHSIPKDLLDQELRAKTPSNQQRSNWPSLFQSTGEHDGSSFPSDLLQESTRRSNFGPSMTFSSESKPHPRDSMPVLQSPARHEQNHRLYMEQPHVRKTESPIGTSAGQCAGCAKLHPIVHDIVSEVSALDELPFRPKHPHEVIQNGLPYALGWVLDVIRSVSASVKDVSRRSEQTTADTQAMKPLSPIRDPRDSVQVASELGKRRAEDYGNELERPAKKARELSSLELSRSINFSGSAEAERRRSHHSVTVPLSSHSPPRAGSSPGSGFLPPPSPLQAPYSVRMLPSPSSLNFPTAPPTLPSISSPAASYHTSAHTAHLQDLQHQISIKTLAHQTLQREYDSLIQKLERQRTKCATLEKKFEVTDTEINSLTDEKERLQAQIAALEMQVEELQHAREEERREQTANGSQYMRILEMASRLQEQGAGEKRKWISEKAELENKIRTLEETGKTTRGASSEGNANRSMINVEPDVSAAGGISDAPDTAGDANKGSEPSIREGQEEGGGPSAIAPSSPSPSSPAQPRWSLHPELLRLTQRVKTLESALTAVGASADAMMELGQTVRDKTEQAMKATASEQAPLSTASAAKPPAASHDASIPAGASPSSEPPVT